MKKAILLVLITVMITSILNGCSTGNTGVASAERNIQGVYPNVIEIGDANNDNGYFYLVDKNTGVVYLGYDAVYRRAITVMLNADGTPITADQLGIEY